MLGRDQKIQYIFSLFSTLEHGTDKLSTKYMKMMTKEVSTKYCNFHDPRCRVSCATVCDCGGGDTNWRIKFMYDVDDLYQYTSN